MRGGWCEVGRDPRTFAYRSGSLGCWPLRPHPRPRDGGRRARSPSGRIPASGTGRRGRPLSAGRSGRRPRRGAPPRSRRRVRRRRGSHAGDSSHGSDPSRQRYGATEGPDDVGHHHRCEARQRICVNRQERRPEHERVETEVSKRAEHTALAAVMEQDPVGGLDGGRERADRCGQLRVAALERPRAFHTVAGEQQRGAGPGGGDAGRRRAIPVASARSFEGGAAPP